MRIELSTASQKLPPLEATTWPRVLADAFTEQAVLDAVRDYLASWQPQELALLPKELRPPAHLSAAEEVVLYAFLVAQARCACERESPALTRMSAFLTDAARQIGLVMSAAKRTRSANA
jgi:hypothetical protein